MWLLLFDAVRPSLRLHELHDWVITADTLRVVDRAPGLVVEHEYFPAARTKCLARYQALSEDERMVAEGIIKQDEVAEIAEVVSGARPPRTSDDEITYYKSIGVPIQDLVTAQHMARRAAERGIGTEIEIGGD